MSLIVKYLGRNGLAKLAFASVFAGSYVLFGQAQESAPKVAPMTLEQCRQYALANQPAMAAANLSAVAGSQRAGSLNRLGFAGMISREVPIRKQQSGWGVSATAAMADQAALDTCFDVNFTYLSILYGQRQLAVAEAAIAELTSLRDIAKTIVKEGTRPDVTNNHVEKIEVMLLSSSARRDEALGGIARANAALREAMGMPSGEPVKLAVVSFPTSKQVPDKAVLVAGAKNQRGEVLASRAAVEVTRWETKAQGVGFFKFQTQTFASGSDLHAIGVPLPQRGEDYLPGGVAPEMPANLAGKKRDRVATAGIYAERAASVAAKTENLAVLEVENFLLRYKENSSRAEKLIQAAIQADKLASRLKDKFDPRSTKVSLDEVLTTGTLSVSTMLDANEALYRTLLDLATLERASGGAFRLALEWPKMTP